jgi:ribose transport system permease protein
MRPEDLNETRSDMKSDVDQSRPVSESDLSTPEPSTPPERPGPSRSFAWSSVGPWAVPILLVLLFAGFSIRMPEIFMTVSNVRVMIGGQATIVLLALAIIIPLRAGDFDLSVASVMILSGCTVGVMTSHGHSALVSCTVAVLIGAAVGVVNGILVVRIGIDSFIATLGTLTILTGLATLVSNGTLVSTYPEGLVEFANHRFLELPAPVWAGWILAVVLWYIFELTPCGRYLLFIGGNRDAAELAGLRVKAFRQGAFIVSGTLSALAGLLFAGSLGSVDPTSGGAYLLPPITAAFLGASAIKLGRFNVAGTLVAIYLLAVGITGLQLLGLQTWIADVFNGACLIVAMGFTLLFRRATAK